MCKRVWIGLPAIVVGLSMFTACARSEYRVTFGGYYFRSTAKPINKRQTLADFTVTIRNVSQSPDYARAAGGYEGTRYCIKNFGTSRINWVIGPATEGQNLRIDRDQITFQGACDPF